jgi:hypothetical protein
MEIVLQSLRSYSLWKFADRIYRRSYRRDGGVTEALCGMCSLASLSSELAVRGTFAF